MKKLMIVAAAGLATLAIQDASAQSVTGSLTFGAPTGVNYFNSSNGFVPAGYGNTSSTTVTIGNGVEFGFSDGVNLDTADFTSTSLTITDVSQRNSNSFYMSFSSSVAGFFNNAAFTSNNFGGTLTVLNNTLTFMSPLTLDAGTRTATISFDGGIASAAPEPGTWAMMIVGFGAVGGVLRRRRKVTTRVSYAV